MQTVRIIPCLDCQAGRVVKGVRFENMKDVGSPAEFARNYEKAGADELVLLDISATIEGRGNQLETVHAVRSSISIPLTVGGGIQRVEDARALLDAGADKLSVNSAAVANPSLIDELAQNFGSQCTILAIDASRLPGEKPRWGVSVHSGKKDTPLDAIAWAAEGVRRGAGEILLTSRDRDGAQCGYDLDLISEISRAVTVPVIASGGARTAEDLLLAYRAGAEALLAASIFHFGEYTVTGIKEFLRSKGVRVRL